MGTTVAELKEEILSEIGELSLEKIKEVLDFVCFIKAKNAIDPSQIYFWTKQWQYMEREADADKETCNIIGDGTVEDLLKEIKG